jgi:hypothetical protein
MMTPEEYEKPVNIKIKIIGPTEQVICCVTLQIQHSKTVFSCGDATIYITLRKMLHYGRLDWFIVPLHSLKLCKFPIIS